MDLIVKRNEEGKNVYTMFDNNQLDLIPKEKRELFCKKLMQFSEQMEINWSDLLYNSIVELNNKLIDPVYYRVIANLRTIKSYVTDNCGNNVIYEYDEKLLAEIDKKTKIIVRNIKKTERIKEKEGLYYYI